MTFDPSALAEDATIAASDEQISSISDLANMQITLSEQLDALAGKTKELQDKLKRVQEVQLPEAMAAAGMLEFKLMNGAKITIKEDLSISVPKSRMLEIATWLRTNGLGDILRETMIVQLDGDETTLLLREFIAEKKMTADAKLDVNSSTLKAVLREQIAEGKNIDLKTFGAYAWRRAIITQGDAR